MTSSSNQPLLREIDEAQTWFRARKSRPIHARLLQVDQTVETIEGPLLARAGDFLCRGVQGEVWPQSRQSLEERYMETNALSGEEWRLYKPKPDGEGVMAASVPHSFEVLAKWGILHGKAGDYLLKQFRDRFASDPEDVWVVARQLFEATYERIDENS